MFTDAEAALEKDETDYTALNADCDAKTEARVKAQSSLDSAESAWGTQKAACGNLDPQRRASMCDFGTKVQAKCSAEAEYAKLVAATKQAKGDADSEVDRESEWLASRTTQCMIAKSMQKGLDGAVAGADLDACVAQVNFAKDVGKLNTRQAEFDTLSKSNACVDGLVTFFNGLTWSVPAGDKPSSKSYTRTQFKPQLDPTSGNFDFCSGAPAPTARVACENPNHATMKQCTLSKMGVCHGRVRMGHDSSAVIHGWTAWKTIDGQFPCSNKWFGHDPARGQAKECICESA